MIIKDWEQPAPVSESSGSVETVGRPGSGNLLQDWAGVGQTPRLFSRESKEYSRIQSCQREGDIMRHPGSRTSEQPRVPALTGAGGQVVDEGRSVSLKSHGSRTGHR